MFLLWHPALTAINLSYTFPILETSATALCGTTGMLNLQIRTVSQVNRVVLSSLLTRHAVLEDRHVDPDTGPESGSLAAAWACTLGPWHGHIWVVNSCVPRIFVSQMLPFLVCLLCLVFFGTALRNLFGCLDGNGCTDFPSQQKSFVKLADISMLCDNMTRWPLTHLCCLKQLCPKNLRARKMFFYVKCWNLFENLSVGNVFLGRNTCTRRSNAIERFPEPAEISTLCQNMWHI